jgi:hypothetical protein
MPDETFAVDGAQLIDDDLAAPAGEPAQHAKRIPLFAGRRCVSPDAGRSPMPRRVPGPCQRALREIGREFGVTGYAVSQALRRAEQLRAESRKLNKTGRRRP